MADVNHVRSILDQDRIWSIYALGDLDPRRSEYCQWHIEGDSLALLYREFPSPILFAAGDPSILQKVDHAGSCYFQIPVHFREAVASRFEMEWTRSMHRMGLDRAEFRAAGRSQAALVRDASALRELYADGRETGEEPDFFMDSQLEDDTFHGVTVDGQLVAAGGTHLFSGSESVAAIGNVYTHRAFRGRGYARAVTAAIVENLLDRGIRTIALNVKSQNAPAIRIYEQLGFRLHRVYLEGFAAKVKNI